MTFACKAHFEPVHFFEDIGTDVRFKVSQNNLTQFQTALLF